MGDIRPGIAARSRRGGWPVALVAIALAAGCTVGGTAVIAPYRSVPLESLSAGPIVASVAGVLALAPGGDAVAVADPVHGICIAAVRSGPAPFCAKVELRGKLPVSAVFSPDGGTIALGQDVTAQGDGHVWLVDARTGDARQVPSPDAAAPTGSAPVTSPRSSYVSMFWNGGTGHLLLVANATNAIGATTRLVDVDPGSLVPRVVSPATGPYEFQTGNIAGGGPSVIFTVTRGDQIPPNLVEINLDSGMRRETGPLGADGTQLVPLAVSPDGSQAIVGSATYGDAGPPRRLELAARTLTDIAGLVGNFALAGYSPNGSQIAMVSTTPGGLVVQVAAAGGGAARTVGRLPGVLTRGSRLTWSGVDALSISSPTPLAVGAVLGWKLRG
ncbi:hypothetical protein [Nakamurella sp. PAMC28650]|uniref:hypothetical protein n=1 Tax=Nakamurella sp. PAMC28650 TaxID=2762325 RepID=UPI00164CE30C|nr:hypothetical protein [Nakamurella sp. PAMC28650]QNK82522.1 hypothetical protein H7F38_07360 [Nakamurella sp. PAMC28650]